MLFQKAVVKKHIALLNSDLVAEAWEKYRAYFLIPEIQENIRQLKEEQFQEGFLRELFVKVLGYTLSPSPDYNLITEQKNETNAKKADGAILLDGKVYGIIELKDHKTTDLSAVEAQAFGYKSKHVGTHLVIISNFEKLRLYIDNAVDYREWNLFAMTEDEFRELYLCLTWPQVQAGKALQMKDESVSDEDRITNALYNDYSQFKRVLFADIIARNPYTEGNAWAGNEKDWQLLLFKKTQKLLDRLLFIFFAEDCGLLPPNSMVQIINQWVDLQDKYDEYFPLYNRIKKYFGYMNTGHQGKQYEIFAYNGGLFKPDDVLDNIQISDDLLAEHTRRLSMYDFESEVDVNILGHIFENSLSEIEEVTQQITNGEAPSVSKRKQDGVFYTPQYITKYIVENTVGRLCAEKKAELGIVEEEYFSDQKRQQQTKKRLLDKLDQYREWLLHITILDPACGSGAFLNAALQFLIAEHKLIDEMEAKITGASIEFHMENSILENNLYGVDINEESVEIAQLALWLRTAKPHRKLSSLNQNIKCGNSLISDPEIAGSKAFNWQEQFPKVFEKGGFDVVIGNPPYVLCQPSNTDEATLNYYKTFEVASYKIDLFHLFFEKGVSLLKPHGYLGFITPNTYLTNKYIKPLRNFLLQNTSIVSIVDHNETVFEEASVDVATIVLHKETSEEHVISIMQNDDNHLFNIINSKKQKDWANDADNMFNIKEEFAFRFVNCTTLGSISKSYFGIQAYDRKASIANEAITEKYLPIIDGEDVQPYSYATPTKYFNYIEDNIKSGGDWSVYSQDRIVIRQIGTTPVVGLCRKNILSSNTMYSIYDISDKYNIMYILAILNSTLIKRYWTSKYSDSKQLFPKIKGYQLKELPIYITQAQQAFIALADQMLSLHAQLQEKRSRFLRRLSENLQDVKITSALEAFDKMTFPAFAAELKKQKLRLSLAQQDEWEDFFNKYIAECREISYQIEATDRTINTLVYDLYGLTDEERQIVERG